MTNVAVPFRFDTSGRTADANADRHVLDLIELVLMTAAGERVNRPDFGSGVPQLVFAPGGDAVAATVKYLVQGALQQWLSDRIQVQDVTVTATDGTLDISVAFINRLTQLQETVTFQPPAVVP